MRIRTGDLVTYSDHFAKEHGHMPQTSEGGLVVGIVTEPTIIGADNTFYSVRWTGQSIDRLCHSDNLRKIVHPLLEID